MKWEWKLLNKKHKGKNSNPIFICRKLRDLSPQRHSPIQITDSKAIPFWINRTINLIYKKYKLKEINKPVLGLPNKCLDKVMMILEPIQKILLQINILAIKTEKKIIKIILPEIIYSPNQSILINANKKDPFWKSIWKPR